MLAPGVRHRRTDESGFTLIELLVTVSILSVIAFGLGGIVIRYLQDTQDSQARFSESHDIQFATAYWTRDVASIGVRSRSYDDATRSFPLAQSVNVAPTCTLPAGTVVGTLAWSEFNSLASEALPTTITVTYLTSGTTDNYTLTRVRCTGGTRDSTTKIANNLRSAPVMGCVRADSGTSCTGAGADVPTLVTLSLVARSPESSNRRSPIAYTATLSGERRQS